MLNFNVVCFQVENSSIYLDSINDDEWCVVENGRFLNEYLEWQEEPVYFSLGKAKQLAEDYFNSLDGN